MGTAKSGIAPGLWLVAAFALLAVPILLNAGPELTIPPTNLAERHSVLADLKQAIIWLKTDRSLISVLVMGMVMVPVGLSWQKLMPIFTRDVLMGGASTLGLILGMSSLGAAISSITLAGTAPTFSIGRVILVTSVLFGCGAIILAFVGNLYLVLFVAVCLGILSGAFLTLSNVAIQIHSPNELRGRVMGAWGMVWGLFPVGGLVAGALTEHLGVVVVIAGSGIICGLFAVGMAIFAPQLRKV
jgi:MFS family permease